MELTEPAGEQPPGKSADSVPVLSRQGAA
jgi:hypothetical protein